MFCDNIRSLRLARNLTQEQIAERLCITPQAVSRWETGVSMPDSALLPEIARTLEVSIDNLFDYECNNTMNLMNIVYKYINPSGKDRAEQIHRLFRVIQIGTLSMYYQFDKLTSELDRYDSSGFINDEKVCYETACSQLKSISDDGFSWLFHTKDFPFNFVFLKPNNGYSYCLENNLDIEHLFSAMGDPDVFRCVVYLLKKTKREITLAALLKKVGISDSHPSAERIQEIIRKLGNIDVTSIWITNQEIDGEKVEIVHYNDTNPCILALFVIAYACSVSSYGSKTDWNNVKKAFFES